MLNAAMGNLQVQPNTNAYWYLDSGATSHITGNAGTLNKLYPPS
jgi:hypothetical protein